MLSVKTFPLVLAFLKQSVGIWRYTNNFMMITKRVIAHVWL